MNPPDESKNNRDHIEPPPDEIKDSGQETNDFSDSVNDLSLFSKIFRILILIQIAISLPFGIWNFKPVKLNLGVADIIAMISAIMIIGILIIEIVRSRKNSGSTGLHNESETQENEHESIHQPLKDYSDPINQDNQTNFPNLASVNKPSKAILIPVALLGAPLLFVFLAYNNMSMETSTIISVAFMVLISSMALLDDETWTNSAILPKFLWALIVIISLSLLPFLAFFITFYLVCRSTGFFGQ